MTDLEISRLAIHDKDDDEQEQEEEDANMIDIDTLPKAPELVSKFKNTRLLWNSIYSNTGHISNEFGLFNEPKFTNYTVVFKGALDYLFVEKDALIEVPKILAIPEEKDVLPSLPNRNFGSDHLCLVADVNY
jgi:RNA exonuclease NGL2